MPNGVEQLQLYGLIEWGGSRNNQLSSLFLIFNQNKMPSQLGYLGMYIVVI